jgi:hypothetical protein
VKPRNLHFGLPEREANIFRARTNFYLQYVREKDWNAELMRLPQVEEIQAQEGWKNPEVK